MNTARTSTGSRSVASDLVFSVLALALTLPSPVGATTADDICAPEADPCTVTTQVAVTDGSVLAFGARQLIIVAGGDLNVGSGVMTITAAGLRIEANGELQALGRNAPGGQIDVTAAMVAISGKVSADGNNGGTITISAMQMVNNGTISADGGHGGVVSVAVTGEFLNGGTVSADGSGADGIGGSVDVMAGFATIAGAVSARASGDNLGGCVTASTEGNLTLVGAIRVDGGDGGEIVVMAGTNAGNLIIDASAVIATN